MLTFPITSDYKEIDFSIYTVILTNFLSNRIIKQVLTKFNTPTSEIIIQNVKDCIRTKCSRFQISTLQTFNYLVIIQTQKKS